MDAFDCRCTFVVALALLAAHAGAIAHAAIERHTRCAVHGEPVEVGTPAVVEVPGPSRPEAAPAAKGEHQHLHCGLPALRRDQASPAPGASVSVARGPQEVAPFPVPPTPAGRAPLAVAPKQSPPTA